MSGFYRIIIIKLVLRYLIIWKGFITLSPFGSSELIPLSFFLLKVSSELIFARHIVVQYLVLKKILTSSGTERGSILPAGAKMASRSRILERITPLRMTNAG